MSQRIASSARPIALAALLAGLLAACGGGGTGAPSGAARLQGLYAYVQYGWFKNVNQAACSWGTFTADGAGGIPTDTSWQIVSGAIYGPTSFDIGPYEIGPQQVLSFHDLGYDYLGNLGAGDRAACLASVAAEMDNPGAMLILKRGGSFSEATIAGAYHHVRFTVFDPDGSVVASHWGTTVFDGVDKHQSVFNINVNTGRIDNFFVDGNYHVTTDGAFTGEYGDTVAGFVLEGGEAILLGGGAYPDSDPTIGLMLRKGANLDASVLSGTYRVIRLERLPTGEASCFEGVLEADGQGQATLSGLFNKNGVLSMLANSPFLYTVYPDGSFILGAVGWLGAVSPSGDFAVCGGSSIGGNQPQFLVMIRESQS